jgi:hypothetical protein
MLVNRLRRLVPTFLGAGMCGVVGCASDPVGDGPPNSADGGSAGSGGSAAGGPVIDQSITVAPEPLHRLNRLEYNNTVRDLLGSTARPGDAFPADPALDGFDNLAEGLSLTPAQFSLYSDAAHELSRAALEVGPRFLWRKLAKDVATGGYPLGSQGWSMYGDDLGIDFELPQAEALTIEVQAGGTTSNAPTPIMSVYFDGTLIETFTVMAGVAAPAQYTIQVNAAAGPHSLRVTFDNFIEEATSNTVNTLVLRNVEIASEATTLPPSRALIYGCDPAIAPDADGCYAQVIGQFARRAFRRAITPEEQTRLVGLWQGLSTTEGKETALTLTIRTLLMSPQFLYRVSLPDPSATGRTVPLEAFSLASRLSYFLWSSMPDDALLSAAEQGALRDDAQLAETVRRMLADPKATGLLEGFAAQWLYARKLATAKPNPEIFPGFDEALRLSMIKETQLFFGDFLTNQRPLAELLTPDFGYVNDRLAQHYGLTLPGSTELVRVTLPPATRGGIIMQGAWLTAQSEPDRTSPVLRGRWITEQVLCVDVPPPPPDVSPAMEAPPNATIRERLELHRASPRCAGCHEILDPPGLGLEEFDGIGQLRTMENGAPINTSGAIPGGAPFAGGLELARAVAADPRFYECLTHKLLTYGLGRRLVEHDDSFLAEIIANLQADQSTLPTLLEKIVLSPAFRLRSMN